MIFKATVCEVKHELFINEMLLKGQHFVSINHRNGVRNREFIQNYQYDIIFSINK